MRLTDIFRHNCRQAMIASAKGHLLPHLADQLYWRDMIHNCTLGYSRTFISLLVCSNKMLCTSELQHPIIFCWFAVIDALHLDQLHSIHLSFFFLFYLIPGFEPLAFPKGNQLLGQGGDRFPFGTSNTFAANCFIV